MGVVFCLTARANISFNNQKMTCPRYSIITVCLNAKDDLIKTLRSIEKQDFNDFEWIVIDGGSTDGTQEVIQGHPLVTKMVSEADSGIFDAMNKGIALARGDYFLFLNAGDSFYDSAILAKVNPFLDHDLVIGSMLHVLFDKDREGRREARSCEERGVGPDYLYTRTIFHQATFIKKNMFERFGGYCTDFKIKGDHDFFARLITGGASYSFVPLCVAVYPLNGLSHQMKYSQLVRRELQLVRKRNYSSLYRLKRGIAELCGSVAGGRS